MLKYLVILLSDTSVSYCHYTNGRKRGGLMDIKILREGIRFAMKENLTIQFVYPDEELPQDYKDVVDSIDHSDIASVRSWAANKADVLVIDGWIGIKDYDFHADKVYVLRTSKTDFFDNCQTVKELLEKVSRLNVVFTDAETFGDADMEHYGRVLESLARELERLYVSGRSPQLNLLTDRMMLSAMNNCNAGWESLTLAPDGNFYVCPAFYMEGSYTVGNLSAGPDIKNPQLYRLDHAPLCRNCDAYQCKRCIWLNRKTTLEVNTPSCQQCVTAHIERNASRGLLAAIRQHGEFLSGQEIKEIDYLDPFEVREKW